MRTLSVVALFMLCASAADAGCPTQDCSQDPKAWADMFGSAPAQREEQAQVKAQVQAFIAEREKERRQTLLDAMPVFRREQMLIALSDGLTKVMNAPVDVMRAVVIAHVDDEFTYCGVAYFTSAGPGLFVIDTSGKDTHLPATEAQFVAAGCKNRGTTLR